MASRYIPWLISAVWISSMLLVFLVIDVSSIRNWALVTTLGIVPVFFLLKLWPDGPPQTVAELLHATEVRR